MAAFLRTIANPRMPSLLALGFSSGLPLGLTGVTLQSWMSDAKIDLKTIGLFSLVTLPYTIKFLWSPIMDRYVPPLLGRRRGWLLVMQILLMLAIAAMGLIGTSSLHMLAGAALVVAFFSASQDIVADAYRTDVLPDVERGTGTAFFVTGYRIAYLAATGGTLFIAGRYDLPWSTIYFIMALAMGVGIVTSVLAPEPAQAGRPPESLAEAVIQPVLHFMTRRGWWLLILFVIVFKIPDVMLDTMKIPFLQQAIGFSKQQIGAIAQSYGLLMSIVGSLCGGVVVTRLGIWRALWLFGILQAISNAGFYSLILTGAHQGVLVGVISVENFCGGLVTAGFVAFLMSLCDVRYSATQYALLSSLMALTRVVGGAPTGYWVTGLGWPIFFMMTIVGAIPGLILLFWLPRGYETRGFSVDRQTET